MVKKKGPKPTPSQYKLMAETCIHLIVEGYARYIELKFPKGTVFPKDFPRGRARTKTETYWVHTTCIIRLLDWLHAKGYSKWNYKETVALKLRASGRVANLERKVLDMVPSLVDNGTLRRTACHSG